jgi:hypothetical protein
MQTRVSTKGQTLHKARIIADPATDLPVLSAGHDAPILRSREVEEILSNFP